MQSDRVVYTRNARPLYQVACKVEYRPIQENSGGVGGEEKKGKKVMMNGYWVECADCCAWYMYEAGGVCFFFDRGVKEVVLFRSRRTMRAIRSIAPPEHVLKVPCLKQTFLVADTCPYCSTIPYVLQCRLFFCGCLVPARDCTFERLRSQNSVTTRVSWTI